MTEMGCDEVLKLVWRRIDLGESISENEARRLRGHLESCEPCRIEDEKARRLHRDLTLALRSHPFGPVLVRRVTAGIREKRTVSLRRARVLWALAAAAVVVVGVSVAIGIMTGPGVAPGGGVTDPPAHPGPYAAQSVVVPEGGERELALRDGSTLLVLGGSRLEIPAAPPSGDFIATLASGGVDVSVTPGPGRRFQINTPDAEVRVVGTRFSLWIGGDGTHVRVVEGRVHYRSLVRGDACVVEAGQEYPPPDAGGLPIPVKPSPPVPVDPSKAQTPDLPVGPSGIRLDEPARDAPVKGRK